jgi:hypothetical protein
MSRKSAERYRLVPEPASARRARTADVGGSPSIGFRDSTPREGHAPSPSPRPLGARVRVSGAPALGDEFGESSDAIIGGVPHDGDPATIDRLNRDTFVCTGSLVAPRVAMTVR